jgi:hypothetical protein
MGGFRHFQPEKGGNIAVVENLFRAPRCRRGAAQGALRSFLGAEGTNWPVDHYASDRWRRIRRGYQAHWLLNGHAS